MLLCTKNIGCNKLDGHRSPCEKRVVKITPELVTITYRKDGKTYLLSMPSGHAEWAEEMLSLDLAEVERAAAEKAIKALEVELVGSMDDGTFTAPWVEIPAGEIREKIWAVFDSYGAR